MFEENPVVINTLKSLEIVEEEKNIEVTFRAMTQPIENEIKIED